MKSSMQSKCYCPGNAPGSKRLDKHAAALLLTVLLAFFYLYNGLAIAADPAGYDPTKAPSNAYSFDFEGCNLDKDVEGTYNPGGGIFLCDSAASWPAGGTADSYTDGNLGKEWNELDEVPHRIGADSSGAAGTETYQIILGADSLINAATTPDTVGYDRISLVTKNSTFSTGTAGNCAFSLIGGNQIADFDIGGAVTQVVQVIQVTQEKDTECVFDLTMRLAIGSSLISGSSNRSFIVAGTGAQSIPLPSDIQPQTLDKSLSAVLDSSVSWSIQKNANPTNLDFGNTCLADTPLQKNTKITISFTKDSVDPTALNATSSIEVNNPSSRDVIYEIHDELFGQNPCGAAESSLDTEDVTETVEPGMETITLHHNGLPAGACNLRNHVTATIKVEDLVTGDLITVGTLEDDFSLPNSDIAEGIVVNQLVKVADQETISGSGFDFSAVQDITGVTGAFLNSYVAGTFTTGPVDWLSDQQSDSGSIEFTKTVRVQPFLDTTGTLADVATLKSAADDSVLDTADANVTLSTNPLAKLTINKTIPQNVADSLEAGQKIIISFAVTRDGDGGYLNTFDMEFGPGDTLKSVTLDDLTPDTYHVEETGDLFDDGVNPPVDSLLSPISGNPQHADLNATSSETCAKTLLFENGVGTQPPVVKVQKITVPPLEPEDPDFLWEFTLNCTGFDPETLSDVEAGADPVAFDLVIDADTECTVTETLKDGWDLTVASPNDGVDTKVCSFSVDILEDFADIVCAFTNVKRGDVDLIKTSSGVPTAGFDFEIRKDASLASSGTVLATGTSDASGVVNFLCLAGVEEFCTNVSGAAKLVPGDYQLCEVHMMPGWSNDLDGYTPDGEIPEGSDNSTECVNFTLTAGETEVFRVNNEPPPGGDARTIGFWKNWTSCDGNGNQDPVLDETLVLAGGSILIGDLVVDTCHEAVSILDKRDLTGKKKASDPAFNLAAQLLAAKLNVVAGAATCPAVLTAIADAQARLDALNFNGVTHGTINKSLASQLNSLASTLDSYNNNTLCP
jgi:hypothetical protein